MKKLLFLLLFAAAGLQGWAEDLYIVGNAIALDAYVWGDGRAPYKLNETGSGTNVYKWTGFLKKGDFKICTGLETWDAYHPKSENQSENFEISDVAQEITTDGANDRKWLVVNPGFFEVTVDLSQTTKTVVFTPQWTDISTAEQLIAFAESVNSATEDNHNGAKWARLTADIDMSSQTFPGIGRDNKWQRYHGTFDGQGHKISHLTMTSEHCALVTVAGGGCVVKNILIDNTCEFDGNGRNAAFISCNNYTDFGNTITIENCGNEANVTGTANNCAGIHGCNYNGDTNITIKNCFNAGNISSTGSESAPISGWLGGNARVENTYNIGSIDNSNNNNSFARWSGGTYVNCFTTLNWGNTITGKTIGYDAANVSSGLLCFTLNGNVSGSEAWKQTLPSNSGDAHPYPGVFAGHAKVYANGDLHCDGTPKGSATYSNTEGENRDAHDFVNGNCSYCHIFDDNYLLVNEYHEIGNMAELHWFSQYVNAGNPTAKAKLTEDVTMEEENQYGYTPIGTQTHPYTGHFNGQGYSITLKINNPGYNYQGLFGVVTDGVFIEKIIVKGYVTGNSYVGGIVGGTNGGSNNAKKTDIWYCGNEAAITANGANGAGIIGVNMDGSASIILTNCYNTGNVTSGSDGGALSGWLGGGWSSVRNCYNSGTVSNPAKAFGRNSGCYFTNCYYTASSGTDNSTENHDNGQPVSVEDEAVASGELCYKLGDAFTQDLSQTNSYPTFGSKQVILNGTYENTATTLTLNDANSFGTNSDFDVTSVTLNRTLKANTWSTFCVPFDMSISDLGNGAEVKTLSGATQNGDNYSMTFTDATSIEAGKPYMVRVPSEVTSFTLSNKTIKGTITPTTKGDLTFTGVFDNGYAPLNSFIISNNKFYNVDTDENSDGVSEVALKAFRGYITVDSGSGVKALTFDFDDDATGISDLNVNDNFNGAIYNLAGQRINKMQKGINIVNGKKILK